MGSDVPVIPSYRSLPYWWSPFDWNTQSPISALDRPTISSRTAYVFCKMRKWLLWRSRSWGYVLSHVMDFYNWRGCASYNQRISPFEHVNNNRRSWLNLRFVEGPLLLGSRGWFWLHKMWSTLPLFAPIYRTSITHTDSDEKFGSRIRTNSQLSGIAWIAQLINLIWCNAYASL